MSNKKTRKTVLSSLMAAIVCIATFIIKIPLPGNGYVHIGDCFVLLSGWVVGPYYGALAAGMGSMLADIFAGFPIYVIPTFVIKALSALIAAVTMSIFKRKNINSIISCIISGVMAGIIVPLGYFVFEYFALSPEIAFIDVWGIALKECVGIVSASLVYSVFNKSGLLKKVLF